MSRSRLIDISVPLRAGMPVWPGDPPFESEILFTEPALVSRISLCVHTGTHIDAPKHRDIDAPGIESIALDRLCGPCRVVTPTARDPLRRWITALPELPADTRRLLIRSGFDHHTATADSPYEGLSPALARDLLSRGIFLVGIDSPTVEALADIESGSFVVHDQLLQSGVIILENIDLHAVADGAYELWCLPLSLPGADGAPARAILRER